MPEFEGNICRGPARDLTAGLIVFLVALPLCLGVALASGAPLLPGLSPASSAASWSAS